MLLAEQIHAFQPTDDRESRSRDTILEHLAAHPGDPFSRDHLAGHLTASALVVSADGERVLLGHHRKLGRWLQFGGHGDPGETDAADVAMREALEESGIEGLKFHPTAARPFDLDVHKIPARGDVPEHNHLDIRYLMVARDGAVPAMREAEHLELRWFTWDETSNLGTDVALTRFLAKARVATALLLTARPNVSTPPA